MTKVLVIEDDAFIRGNILELLDAEGFEGSGRGNGKEGIGAALANVPDVIICDITMPVMDGHQVLRRIRDYPDTAGVPFIFLTARAERDDVREGMRLGADDYITKPFTRDELLDSIHSRLARRDAVATAKAGRASRPAQAEARAKARPTGPVVCAAPMRALYDKARRAAKSDLSVLLLGETGVGKDVLAHAIHKASPRADAPFIPLNCGALVDTLIESELFGHDKDSFTGANKDKPGLFEAANGGTVFLDEIGDLPANTQAKLLRVLEERRVLRVGGRSYRDVDVRFVAATNRDLEADVETGRFRADLFFRIGGLVLTVPPLRDRRDDVIPLVERFAENVSRQLNRDDAPVFSPEAVAALERYDWPGNVRELRNVVERTLALSEGGEVRVTDLPEAIQKTEPCAPEEREIAKLEDKMRDLEKRRVIEALERCGGNQTRAAADLGVSRRTLLNRLDAFGLPRPRKK